MLRLGEKYGHLAHRAGCGCRNPELHAASRRLETLSRRGLLGGAAAAARQSQHNPATEVTA